MPLGRLPLTGLKTLALAVLAWGAFVGAGEVCLRLAGLAPRAPVLAARYDKFEPDPDLIWTLKKRWSGLEPNGAPVRTDELGHRGGRRIADRKRPDVRVLFLGDSVTYGHHLADEQTIAHRLELELRRSTLRDVEVINAAVPGYSTFQELEQYRKVGRLLSPDLVLLGFCFNDVTERYTALAAYGGASLFMINVDTTVGLNAPLRWWHRSALRNGLGILLASAAKRGERYRVSRLWEEPESAEITEAWELVFGEVDALAAEVHAAQSKLAVVIFPYAVQVQRAGASTRAQHRIGGFLASRGIPQVDLLPGLRAQGAPAQRLFLDENHLSAQGSAVAARYLAEGLQASGSLPSP